MLLKNLMYMNVGQAWGKKQSFWRLLIYPPKAAHRPVMCLLPPMTCWMLVVLLA